MWCCVFRTHFKGCAHLIQINFTFLKKNQFEILMVTLLLCDIGEKLEEVLIIFSKCQGLLPAVTY